MKAIILAAGLGTRLRLNIPKPMYEINGKPILEHNILLLKKHNITDIYINVHFLPDVIKNYFKDGKKWGVKLQYSFEEKLFGTSGAIKNIENFWDKEPFFVLYGDNFTDVNLTDMLKVHTSSNAIATIAVFDPTKALNSGIAGGFITMDQNNSLLSFIEGNKGKENGYVNAGVYLLEPRILDMIPSKVFSDFGNDIFPKLLKERYSLKGYLTNSFVMAIDTKEALEKTVVTLKREGKPHDNN